MSYHCPYCRYTFEKEKISIVYKENKPFYYCPNPKKKNGRKVCGKYLPLDFLDSKTIFISIIGSPFVGKTHFMLSLLYQLRHNKTLEKAGIVGDILGGKKENPELYELLDDIYDGKTIEFTQEITNVVIDISIIKNNKRNQIYLSLYDNPGEFFLDPEKMINRSTNTFQSDGIIFLIEPKQLINYTEKIINNHPYERESHNNSIYQIMKNISLLLPSNNNFGRLFKKVPLINKYVSSKCIAFTISKFDQLNNYIDLKIPFDNDSDSILNGKEINLEFFESFSNRIFNIVNENDIRIKSIVDSFTYSTAFFGVKVADVNEKGKVTNMNNSQGVILPFLWMLNQLNLIK